MKSLRLFAIAVLCGTALCVQPVLAWGEKGHTMINDLAARGFQGRMPAFLSAPEDVVEIQYLGPEMDRIKGAGSSWDGDEDPGHYVDLLDNGTIAGVVNATAMPKDREAYDDALRTANTDQYRQGYLPYEILDGWEQLRQDFAYWRVDEHAGMSRERQVMERVIAQDLGIWGHFVGDGSQPLHVTVHFNGWGDFANPQGYTQSRETHSMFESDFVNRFITQAQVQALMRPTSQLSSPHALLTQDEVMSAIMTYLSGSNRTVPQLYQIEKRGGFESGSSEARAFTAARLAAGAMELRDLAVWAWQDSLYAGVGYPEVPVQDVLSGKARWPGNRN